MQIFQSRISFIKINIIKDNKLEALESNNNSINQQ